MKTTIHTTTKTNHWMISLGVSSVPELPSINQAVLVEGRASPKRDSAGAASHKKRGFNVKEESVRLYDQGFTVQQIADVLDSDAKYVHKVLVQAGRVEKAYIRSKNKPVVQLSETGEIIAEYKDCHDAAKALRMNGESIRQVCRGVRKTVKGLCFAYK